MDSQLYWIWALGFIAQALFAARLLIQWVLSEKEGRVVSPVIYWQLSVVASYLFIIYGILQDDFVIIIGQAMSYIIAVRNLQLDGSWMRMSKAFRAAAVVLPFLTMLWIFMPGTGFSARLTVTDLIDPVFMSGAIGQLLLNFRFVYQWYHAEKYKTSLLPIGFWIMTAVGSLMVVLYAVDRFDPVLLAAQGLGLVASLRNIQLHYKNQNVS